jgi:creatinine amidohydrolase
VARYRPFREMTATGVIGDARRATPEKGRAFLDAAADALVRLLRERGDHA